MAEPRGEIGDVVANARVIACVGAGGVGKTSLSAAIALHAAQQGRRVIVLTIDPAHRLARALGLMEIGNEETVVSADAFLRAGCKSPRGTMTAMMLDIKRSWDETVKRHHPDARGRDCLLRNRFYHSLSTALAGSQEYMAMEKLHELVSRTTDPLDLVVLDTPPAQHAFDFLEAPSKIIEALDNEATRWLIDPYVGKKRAASRVLDAGSTLILKTLGRFTGTETLEALAELLRDFQGMFEGFGSRAKAVRAILNDVSTRFFVVGSPREEALSTARSFFERLSAEQLRVGAFVLNRAASDPFEKGRTSAHAELRRALVDLGESVATADRLEALALGAHALAKNDHATALALQAEVHPIPVALIAELPSDVHDLLGLDALCNALFAGSVA